MSSLQISSVPQELYGYLQKLAITKNKSLENQVIALLYQAKQYNEKREQLDRTASLEKLIRQVYEYLDLKDDWDGYGGIVPTQKTVDNAIQWLKTMPELIPFPEPMLAGSGAIGFYWEDKGIYAEIGFTGDDSFWCYAEDTQGNEVGEDVIRIGDELPPELLKMLISLR